MITVVSQTGQTVVSMDEKASLVHEAHSSLEEAVKTLPSSSHFDHKLKADSTERQSTKNQLLVKAAQLEKKTQVLVHESKQMEPPQLERGTQATGSESKKDQPQTEGENEATDGGSRQEEQQDSFQPPNQQENTARASNATSASGYDYKLVDKNLHDENDLKCPICLQIPRAPAKVECCGSIFCNDCITLSKQKIPACPLCGKTNFKLIKDKSLERRILSLRVHCINYTKGCRWTGELRYAQQHLNEVTPAALSSLRADFFIRATSQLLSWRGKGVVNKPCQYQPTTCKKCDKNLLCGELDHHSKTQCQQRLISCEFKFAGCQFECPELSMQKHLQESMAQHLSLVTKHSRSKRSLATYWLPLLLTLVLVILCFALFEKQLQDIGREIKNLEKEVKNLEKEVNDMKPGIIDYVKDKLKEWMPG